MPTPATMRVVQIEPGPWPILMVLAPASARNSTPSALVTLPAMRVRSANSLRSMRMASPTPLEKPCAVETATASTPSSTSLPTCPRMRSRSSSPSAVRWAEIAAPHIKRKWLSRAGLTDWWDSASIRSMSDKVKSPRRRSSSSTTSSL